MGSSEIRGSPGSALRSVGLKQIPTAPELCEYADFLRVLLVGGSWKENSPGRSQSHLQKWLQENWNLDSSRVSPTTTQDPRRGA